MWAILSDRLRDALREVPRDEATRATLAEVAEHRLDPYAAADRLLESLGFESEVTPTTGDGLVTRPFVVLVAAGLAFFTAGSAVLPVASQFAEGPLDADTIGVGVAIGAFAIGSLLLRPVVGWGSDRYGRRPMLVFGALLSVAALGLHLVVDSLPLFILARAMLGAAEAFFFVALLAAASDLAPPGRSGEAFNLASLALYIGLALGPPIGETVLDSVGYDAVWVVAAGLTIVAAVLSLAVPETAPAVLAAAAGETKRVRVRLFHPAGLFPGLLVLLGTWGMAGYFAFVPLHAKADRHVRIRGAVDGLRRARGRAAAGVREAPGPDGRGTAVGHGAGRRCRRPDDHRARPDAARPRGRQRGLRVRDGVHDAGAPHPCGFARRRDRTRRSRGHAPACSSICRSGCRRRSSVRSPASPATTARSSCRPRSPAAGRRCSPSGATRLLAPVPAGAATLDA